MSTAFDPSGQIDGNRKVIKRADREEKGALMKTLESIETIEGKTRLANQRKKVKPDQITHAKQLLTGSYTTLDVEDPVGCEDRRRILKRISEMQDPVYS